MLMIILISPASEEKSLNMRKNIIPPKGPRQTKVGRGN